MPLYDVSCGEHRTEVLRPAGMLETACPVCGEAAHRVYGYKTGEIREPEADVRGMFRRWREASEELADKGVKTPDIWKDAKLRANLFSRAGENPVVRS